MLVGKLAASWKEWMITLCWWDSPFPMGRSLSPLSALMHPPWPTQMRSRTSFMKTWIPSSPLFPTLINSSFLVTSMQELAVTAPPGKEWLGSMGLATATAMAYYSSIPVLNMAFWSLTPFSTFLPATGHHGCTLTLSIDILSLMSSSGRGTGRTCRSQGLCVVLECWTDHHLLISKLNFCIQPKRHPLGMKTPKCLNINKLKLSCIKQFLTDTLEECLEATMLDNQGMESAWAVFHETVYNTAMECLGPTTRKHKDWFDENNTEIMQLLEDKCHAYRAHLDDLKSTAKKNILRNFCSTTQLKLCLMQDSWLSNKADEIQGFADRNNMKNFYGSLKEVYGPPPQDHHPSSVQMVQHWSLTKRRFLKDGLGTLTAYSIIPPPSMMKPLTGYPRYLLMGC